MDVSLKSLSGYLEQIHTFLINNENSYVFPLLTMALEDVLCNIAKDTNYLKKLDEVDCRIWAKKIGAVLENNKSVYTLSYSFENFLGKKVMMFKKVPVPSETTVPIPKEPLGLKLLRKPHPPNSQPASMDKANTVMSSFKTTCLNATLKFVKNDNQLILQYPDISTEQADFIKHMIAQCLCPKDISTTPGGRGIFESLAEALRIYNNKYDFRLNNGVPSKDDMKRMYFEKIPKKITVSKDFDTCSSSSTSSEVESNQNITQLIQKLNKNFIRKTIRSIKEFLLNEDGEIEFANLNTHEGNFLVQWKSVLISSEAMKHFDDDVQEDLRRIKTLIKGVCKIKTYLESVSPTQRTVLFRKQWARDISQKDEIQVKSENKPKPIIKINTLDDKTLNSKTDKKTLISLLNKSKNSMTFSTFNESMNYMTDNSNVAKDSDTVTNKMTGNTIHIPQIKLENEIISDNTTINSIPKMEMNFKPKSSLKVNKDTIKVNNDTLLNTTSVIKVNNDSSNSYSTEKTKSCTEFNKIFLNENTTPFNKLSSEVGLNNNMAENFSTAKANTTKNSSTSKGNTAENFSMATGNATENSSTAKANTTDNSSITKTNTSENSSIGNAYMAENSAMATGNATENSSTAKANTTKNSLITKTNTTENSSIANAYTAENSSTAKANTTKNSSITKSNMIVNSAMDIGNAKENTSTAKANTTDNSSITKTNTTENSSIANAYTAENSSVATGNATENFSTAKANTTKNSSITKSNMIVNSAMNIGNATENSSTAKDNTIKISMAKANTTKNSSMTKGNTSVDSCMANLMTFTMKPSVNSKPTKMNVDKINDDNAFIVNKALKDTSRNPLEHTSMKKKKLGALKTALKVADDHFIEQAITKLRDFISSKETIETLSFTELSKAEQVIILNWEYLINRYEINCMFCVRGQMILDEIRSLLENGRKTFKVTISSKTVSPINRTVTFTRTLKKKPKAPVADIDYPDLLSNCNIHVTKEKMDKRIQKFFNSTNSITDEWIENSLKQLKSFLQDESQAHLVINNVSEAQIAFLSKWKTILLRNDVIEHYNTDVQRLLIDIKIFVDKILNVASWSVTCTSTKIRRDLTRDMTFMKFPNYDDNKKAQAPTKPAKLNSSKEIAPKVTSKAEITTKIVEPVKSDKLIPKSCSVTSLPVQKVPVLSERGRPKSATLTPSLQAKAQLIQGLSQPVVSEKGMKMMKNMGWDGGALGLRGEGIVEPIALPLDLKTRAGLGCEKKEMKRSLLLTDVPVMTDLPVNITIVNAPHNKLNKMEFKIGLLDTILDMVEMATPAAELVFSNKITQKNWNFIKQSVISFNERTKYVQNVPILKDLGRKIVDRLSQSNSIITACWGVSKKNILFLISNAVYEPREAFNDWCSIVNFDNPKVMSNKMSEMMSNNDDNVIVAGDAFRYYVLAQILEFCDRPFKSNDKVPSKASVTKEIALKGTLASRQMSYITDTIIRLNNKSRASTDSGNETTVFNEIIDAMIGYSLDVDFPITKCSDENKKPVYKTIRFHKILNTTTSQQKNIHAAIDTKRRTTFTSDTFDEKCMFDSQTFDEQNAPILERDLTKVDKDKPIDLDATKLAEDSKHDRNEPKIDQDTPISAEDVPKSTQDERKCIQDPKHDQDELKHDNNALKYDQDVPKIVQDALKPEHNLQKNAQNAPKIDLNEPCIETANIDQDVPKIQQYSPKRQTNLPKLVDGICCTDYLRINDENDVERTEYIFIDNEIVESMDTVTKNIEVKTHTNEGINKNVIANLGENIQNLSLDDNIESTESLIELQDSFDCENTESKIQNFNDKDCKRPISNASTPNRPHKKTKFEKYFKKVIITPENYPQNEMTNEIAAKIQKSILSSIDYKDELPLLQCHGIQDGGLVYSCHTEKSFNLISNVIKPLDLIFTISPDVEIVCHIMTVTIRSFIKESVDAIFERLEAYNCNLDTWKWKVLDIERGRDYVIISVEVDENSYQILQRENFTLYAGIDQAKFSILWE